MRQETIRLIVELACNSLLDAGFKRVNVSTNAPITYEGVVDMFTFMKERGVCFVSLNGLSGSIYGDREAHAYIRAFHDLLHYQLKADFSFAGECQVADAFLDRIVNEVELTDHEYATLWADTVGQLVYFHVNDGAFVKNQQAFNKAFADLMVTAEGM